MNKVRKRTYFIIAIMFLVVAGAIIVRQTIEANKFENRFDFDLISPDIIVESVEPTDPNKTTTLQEECRKEGEIAKTGEFVFGSCCEGLVEKSHDPVDNIKDVGLYCEKP